MRKQSVHSERYIGKTTSMHVRFWAADFSSFEYYLRNVKWLPVSLLRYWIDKRDVIYPHISAKASFGITIQAKETPLEQGIEDLRIYWKEDHTNQFPAPTCYEASRSEHDISRESKRWTSAVTKFPVTLKF